MKDRSILALDQFPTLKTERLVLRKVHLEDAPALFESWSDYEVQKYNAPVMENVDEARKAIEHQLQLIEKEEEFYWAITQKDRNIAMGMCGFNYWDLHHRRAAIGYDLARKYWGNGYGREAVHAIIQFGFEKMNLNRVEANTIEDNYGSVNMLQKLGFTLEGVRRKYSWEDDETFHNGTIWSMLQSEFVIKRNKPQSLKE